MPQIALQDFRSKQARSLNRIRDPMLVAGIRVVPGCTKPGFFVQACHIHLHGHALLPASTFCPHYQAYLSDHLPSDQKIPSEIGNAGLCGLALQDWIQEGD